MVSVTPTYLNDNLQCHCFALSPPAPTVAAVKYDEREGEFIWPFIDIATVQRMDSRALFVIIGNW